MSTGQAVTRRSPRGERCSFRARRAVSRRGEEGAALVIGLVLLLAMTVLGVSGMGTAALELAMAGNAQSQEDAFHAAESGIDIAIARRAFATSGPVALEALAGDGEMETVTTFEQAAPPPDAAFSLGAGGRGIQAFHFDVVATGRGSRNARSKHTQGFYVIGPTGPAD